MHVFVVDRNHQPLMPTTPSRARRWIKSGEATPFFRKGVFCIRLNRDPSGYEMQPIAVGIDPGSKKEGVVAKSAAHTFLNVQADAVTHVKDAVEVRRTMRRGRRYRKTPCRQNRKNRARGGLPPSTKARWQWKLRIADWLCKLMPVTHFVVEDVAAKTRAGQRHKRWNRGFSPLEVGKQWFYAQLAQLGEVWTREGWQTALLRTQLGLEKTKKKLAEVFAAHCVDAWVLAREAVGGSPKPDDTRLVCITPLRWHRRQLHRLQPAKGGERARYGGTHSLGFKRGSLVRHPKHGLTYVGGHQKGRLSLHAADSGERLCLNAKPEDCKTLAYGSWRTRLLPLASRSRTTPSRARPRRTDEAPPPPERRRCPPRPTGGL